MSCWTSSLKTTTSSSGRTSQRTVRVWATLTRYPPLTFGCGWDPTMSLFLYLHHLCYKLWRSIIFSLHKNETCIQCASFVVVFCNCWWRMALIKYLLLCVCVCQPYRVRGCILTLVERMDEEFTKIMQNTDPHSQGENYFSFWVF